MRRMHREARTIGMNSPCKECGKRVAGCHSSCLEYKEFRERIEQKKKVVADRRNAESTLPKRRRALGRKRFSEV